MEAKVTTQAQAIGLLIQAVDVAQSRGTFKLEEAALLTQAIHLLVPSRAQQEDDNVESEDTPGGENE